MPTKTAKKTARKVGQPKADVYQIVTEKVLAMLAEGTVPWRQPWVSVGVPRSMSTGKPYRGINPFLLLIQSMTEGYTSSWWGTYDHIAKLGGQVRKGQESTTIVWWSRGSKEVTDEATEETVTKSWATARLFRVFNADQADGLPEKFTGADKDSGLATLPELDAMTAAYEATLRELTYGGDRAYYSPLLDVVRLPPIGSYKSVDAFYSTKGHELTHSTGHKSRLKREGIVEGHSFGDELYSREELIAEMGAAMFCGMLGIEQTTLPSSAAYLANWLGVLRGDSKMVVTAAAAAQKAVDMILGTEFDTKAEAA